jgi:hypothetical protein
MLNYNFPNISNLFSAANGAIIWYNLGFDAHKADPLAEFQFLDEITFTEITKLIMQASFACTAVNSLNASPTLRNHNNTALEDEELRSPPPIISVLEGGYHLEVLAESAYCHVKVLSGGYLEEWKDPLLNPFLKECFARVAVVPIVSELDYFPDHEEDNYVAQKQSPPSPTFSEIVLLDTKSHASFVAKTCLSQQRILKDSVETERKAFGDTLSEEQERMLSMEGFCFSQVVFNGPATESSKEISGCSVSKGSNIAQKKSILSSMKETNNNVEDPSQNHVKEVPVDWKYFGELTFSSPFATISYAPATKLLEVSPSSTVPKKEIEDNQSYELSPMNLLYCRSVEGRRSEPTAATNNTRNFVTKAIKQLHLLTTNDSSTEALHSTEVSLLISIS